jgi:hypothetical protein
MIRDELLTSERYWAVSIHARQLFVHLMLSVDDFGCYTGANFAIRARCYPVEKPEPDTVERMLQELIDQDLVRAYHVRGARYIWIPRFRQRMRMRRLKYPQPPFPEFNDLAEKMSDNCQADDGHVSDICPPKRREVKRSEEKGREEKKVKGVGGDAAHHDDDERKGTPIRGSRLPDDWLLPDDWKAWAVQAYHLDPQRVVRVSHAFRDYWVAKSTNATKRDWLATWRSWVRKEFEHA